MEGISYKGDPRAVLCHFNEKHDSNGRFAKKSGGTSTRPTTQAPTLYSEDVVFKHKGATQDLLQETLFDPIASSTFVKRSSKDVKELVNSDTMAKIISMYYVSDQSINDSDYLRETIGGYRKHDKNDYIKAGIAITANIIQDYKLAAVRSGIPEKVVNKAIDGEVVDTVAKEVGKALGEYYNKQSLAPRSRKKYVDPVASRFTEGVQKREFTRDDLKKQNPDLPATAIDEMYKAMKKENKSMRGGSSMPSSTVKHEISYKDDPRAVLCHFNPNHNPQNGQFTSGSSFGMDKYIKIDENGKKVLTEAGMARWEYDKKRNAQKKKDDKVKDENQLIDPHRWVKEDLDAVQQGLQNAQNMTKSLSDFEKKKLAQRPLVRKKKLDLSEMTDQDLNNQINRYLLEQRYQDIFNPKEPPEVSKGKKWLMNTLEVAGGALAVGVSAVTIAKAVHDMKKGT